MGVAERLGHALFSTGKAFDYFLAGKENSRQEHGFPSPVS